MAYDVQAAAQKYLKQGTFDPQKRARELGYGKPDLGTSEGLLDVANKAGGEVSEEAGSIMNPKQGFLGKVGGALKTGLKKTLDVLQRPNYAVATAVKNVIDEDPTTGIFGGLKTGITGQTKNTFHDVFTEANWNPESRIGKITKGASGFALDVLLDPTTYVTFGSSVGIKVGEKTLSKAGMEFLQKGLTQKGAALIGEDAVKTAILNLAEKSPELYGKFLDKGGMKFFGNTLVSSGRIAGVIEAIPGYSKLDVATQPVRNTLYALFNRNATKTGGKLPKEYSVIEQKFRDLGFVRTQQSLNKAIDIAKANGLSSQEADLITNAIETKLPLADGRLENARKQIETVLSRSLKNEQRAGISVGELPNYVPHILVDTPTKNLNYIPPTTKVNLGSAKGRKIGKLDFADLNIGLDVSDGTKLTEKQVRTALKKFDVDIIEGSVHASTTEPTFVARLSRKLTDEEMNTLTKELKQEAIPQLHNGEGKLFGPKAKDWGDFNPDLFLDNKGAAIGKDGMKPTIGKGENVLQATVKEINEAFGEDFFDENIIRTTAIRSMTSAKAVTTKEFVTEITQKFGVAANLAPSNYVETGIKGLEGFKFHPEIAEAMTTFHTSFVGDEATNALLQQFDKLQNFWKASVTQIFPAFHGRNAISNVFLNFLDIGADAINPIKHSIAVDLLNKNRIISKLERLSLAEGGDNAAVAIKELLESPILKDVSGKTWTFGELREVIQNNRVAFGNEFSGAADVAQSVSQGLKQTDKLDTGKKILQNINPLSSDNAAFKAGRAVGNTIEEQARLVNFITNLQRTGDVQTAAGRVKQFLFDYQNLSPFEKNVMRRLIPFYTFTRKNLELQATQFLKQPGKYTGQAKLFSSVSDLASGAGLTEEEQDKLPGFLKQGLGIVIGRDDKNVEILNSLGTPLEAVFGSLQKNSILGSLSPTISIPLQLATQRNFFYDRPLDEVNDASAFKDAPGFIKDYIGFTVRTNKDGSDRYVALNPTRLFVVSNLPPTARVLSSVRQLQTENVSGKLKILQQVAGIKPYATNTEDNEALDEKQKTRELQNVLDDAGVAPIFKKSFIPKDKVEVR